MRCAPVPCWQEHHHPEPLEDHPDLEEAEVQLEVEPGLLEVEAEPLEDHPDLEEDEVQLEVEAEPLDDEPLEAEPLEAGPLEAQPLEGHAHS